MRRLMVALAASGLAAVAVTACSSSGGSANAGGGSSGGDYVIGYVNGMSGPVAVYGQYSLAYLQAAVKDANASGGVNGKKIIIDVLDSAASGSNAVAATEQMITSKHPDVIYGMTLSADCTAVGPVVKRYKTPLVCASTSDGSVNPVQPYVFASQALEGALAAPAVNFALQHLKLPKGSTYETIINPAQGGEDFAGGVDAAAQAAGLTKAGSESIAYTAVNPATQVAQAVSSKPAVVFMDAIGPDIQATAQGFTAAGLNTPIVAIFSSLGYDGFTKLADPNLYEVMQTNYVTPALAAQSAGVAQVQKILEADGMSTPSVQDQQLGPQALLPGLAIVQGLKACGASCTPEKMATALESATVNLDGFAKNFTWSASDHVPVHFVDVVGYDAAAKSVKTVATDLSVTSGS
jgi:branched-chain amino acid transport system substrate-binding protein